MIKLILPIILLATGCATTRDDRPEKNWIEMFNDARNWQQKEEAVQEMQRNDHIRYVEQTIRVVGFSEKLGSNPPHPLEREAVLFWTTVEAMHDWQDHPDDWQAKNRAVVGMRRLVELQKLTEVGNHVKWLVFRIQEMDGAKMPQGLPEGYPAWRFTERIGGYGSYKLYEPPSDLQKRIGIDKMGGYLGMAISIPCAILLIHVCRPHGWGEWALRSVTWDANVTVFDKQGSEIRIKHPDAKPARGFKEPE